MGHLIRRWQDPNKVLRLFADNRKAARKRYRASVGRGMSAGPRPEMVGGGLVRSSGGWQAVKASRRQGERLKGDERILCDSDFVEAALKAAQDELECRTRYEIKGYHFDWLLGRAASLVGMSAGDIMQPGRYPKTVKAVSIFLSWEKRELGISTVALAKRFKLSQPSISPSI